MHDFGANLKTPYSKLVTTNELDHRSCDVRQHVLIYYAVLKLCTDELADCVWQITQLTTQLKNIFSILDKLAKNKPKEA